MVWLRASPTERSHVPRLNSLSFLLYIHFSDSLFDSVKPNNQSKWCLSPTVGHGASVCRICFTTFQWCRTPVWPGISMPIALSKSPDSWGLCAMTLILPLWFKWPLTKTQTVVKTKTVQFQAITREGVLLGASPWKKPRNAASINSRSLYITKAQQTIWDT